MHFCLRLFARFVQQSEDTGFTEASPQNPFLAVIYLPNREKVMYADILWGILVANLNNGKAW